MSIETQFLNLLDIQLNNLNFDKIFNDINYNYSYDKIELITGCESLYYKELVGKRYENHQLLNFLNMLRDNDTKPSHTTLLYMVYTLDKLKNKEPSDHGGMYI